MIIWNGWGILGVLIPGLAAAAMAGIASATGLDAMLMVGAGLALGAIGAFFAGKWFNETNAEQQAAKWRGAREQELMHLVHAGQFQVAPGYAQPRSLEEAQQQAAAMVQAEHQAVAKKLRNRHTVFWVPMQWFSLVLGALGLVIIVMSFTV